MQDLCFWKIVTELSRWTNAGTGAQHVADFGVTEGAMLAAHHDSLFLIEDESVKVLGFEVTAKTKFL